MEKEYIEKIKDWENFDLQVKKAVEELQAKHVVLAEAVDMNTERIVEHEAYIINNRKISEENKEHIAENKSCIEQNKADIQANAVATTALKDELEEQKTKTNLMEETQGVLK